MCGFIGIYGSKEKEIALDLYDGMIVLQHRGQDATGIITYDSKTFHLKKGQGLVRDVFDNKNMLRLKGHVGIGHLRYPTCGDNGGVENAQPFINYSPYGIIMAHNGNVTNFDALKQELIKKRSSSC